MNKQVGKKKLLLLDGIGGAPLGRELYQAFQDAGFNCKHYDLARLQKINFYSLKAAFAKIINKREDKDGFFHLPKLDQNRFRQIIQLEKPDCILVVGFIYKFLSPEFLRKLKNETGCSVYLFDTDSCNLYAKRREFIFFIENELPVYDEIFSFSKVTTDFFRETRGLRASFFPFGAREINEVRDVKRDKDVLFVGSADLRRIFLLEKIKTLVHVYGDRWERNFPLVSTQLRYRITDHSVWGDELNMLLKQANIVLNITRTQFYGAETGVNLRIFEALSAGCFLLTDYCDEIADLFDVGSEIETFKTSSEMVDKINYFLSHPDERNQIAARGHQKFKQCYTWQARARDFAARVNLEASSKD